MRQIQTAGIIRQRGQLTIPDDIRETHEWASPGSVVTVATSKPDEIVIRPYSPQREVDWDTVWKAIKRARSIKGKGPGNLSAFIAKDRQTHF